MKFYCGTKGFVQSLTALSICAGMTLMPCFGIFASQAQSKQIEKVTPQSASGIFSATATATTSGVVLQWRAAVDSENVGFNIYRLSDGERARVNQEIIPGSLLVAPNKAHVPGGYTFSWFDSGGRSDATYYIESVNLNGSSALFDPIKPAGGNNFSEFERTAAAGDNSQAQSANSFEKFYPALETPRPDLLPAAIQDQWAIAAQQGLKIGVKKDGWFRVTQQQMAAAGFTPIVDIRNLRLFVDAREVAINTSQSAGAFGSSDYIEFYGQGLDTPTTDTRTYYLIAGTMPGKRVSGDLHVDSAPPPSILKNPATQTSSPGDAPAIKPFGLIWRFLDLPESPAPKHAPVNSETEALPNFAYRGERVDKPTGLLNAPNSSGEHSLDPATATTTRPLKSKRLAAIDPRTNAARDTGRETASLPIKQSASHAVPTASRQGKTGKKKGKRKKQRTNLVQRNHVDNGRFPPSSFEYTVERKDRTVYFSGLLNGDKENFFGKVLTFTPPTPANPNPSPPSVTINVPNVDTTGIGVPKLEVALQGAKSIAHQISIEINNQPVGSFSFFAFEHDVKVFELPMGQLLSGANTIKFVTASGELSLVDYVRITYPHALRADSSTSCSTPGRLADESLKFSLRGTQSVKVDGFCAPLVRLIDYTDPFNVSTATVAAESSALGYSITVPTSASRSKEPRLLYAFANDQFQQPASVSLNQPSTLNANTNNADFLIVTEKSLSPSMEPLKIARQNQGMTVSIVDIDDVYDEFSYGVHGPQALKDFLSYAATQWAKPPRYVVFAGDATYDPRNYANNPAGIDLVPTKLVDATFSETASDEWLADFDNDGIAEIAIGRLPVRNPAEADLIISKIVNFSPAQVPQSALLVADAQNGFYYNFVAANDQVQALLPSTMTVQRVNLDTAASIAQANADIIAGFNDGRALVNYSGHGNVDVWSGASVFTAANARALTNGNKLSFVVVMDCLNGYFQEPNLESMAEALVRAPGGGAVAAFASSGLTVPEAQHDMSTHLYSLIYGPQPIALGDAIKTAKASTTDIDVRHTWIYFGDPSLKIR